MTLSEAQITKEICFTLSVFNNLKGIDKNVDYDEIKEYDIILSEMKTNLMKKYQKALNWKL